MSNRTEDTKGRIVGIVDEKAESFVQLLHDLDYVIDERARTILCKDGNLADSLAFAITKYELYRESHFWGSKELHRVALEVFYLMETAFVHGVVKVGEGLIRKLKESEAKSFRLEQENQILSSKVMEQAKKLKEFNIAKRQFRRDNK